MINKYWVILSGLYSCKINEESNEELFNNLNKKYKEWILQGKSVQEINFKLDNNNENKEWKIVFKENCYYIINCNNSSESYTLIHRKDACNNKNRL